MKRSYVSPTISKDVEHADKGNGTEFMIFEIEERDDADGVFSGELQQGQEITLRNGNILIRSSSSSTDANQDIINSSSSSCNNRVLPEDARRVCVKTKEETVFGTMVVFEEGKEKTSPPSMTGHSESVSVFMDTR